MMGELEAQIQHPFSSLAFAVASNQSRQPL